jgi:hypothetical protein
VIWYVLSAEPTVQQEDTPHPPPARRGGDADGMLFSEPPLQLKEDITFFTSLDAHFGHSVFFSGGYTL